MTTSSVAHGDLIEALDAQCEDYQAMHHEGVLQRDCLRGDDLTGLNAATGRMRVLMDRVRMRQASMPTDLALVGRTCPQVAQRTECLRQTIQRVLDLRDQSEATASALLADTRRQLQQVGAGRRASRGYRRQPNLQEARFVDNVR
jgi:hypothetical protein